MIVYINRIEISMDDKTILQKIIDENGSCDWIVSPPHKNHYICSKCPMSKLRKNYDGSDYISCVDALNVHHLSGDEQDEVYKEQATKMLFDIIMDEMLGE